VLFSSVGLLLLLLLSGGQCTWVGRVILAAARVAAYCCTACISCARCTVWYRS
jgi:hypothetical protein